MPDRFRNAEPSAPCASSLIGKRDELRARARILHFHGFHAEALKLERQANAAERRYLRLVRGSLLKAG